MSWDSEQELVPTADNFLDLSVLYYNSRRYRDSIAAARYALKLKPDFAEALNNIAASLLALGELDPAISAADEALRVRPNYQLARNNRAAAKRQKMANQPDDGDAPRFSQDWFDGNIPYWSEELSLYRGKSGLRFLEIGCFEGRATRWLLDNILSEPSSTIEVIDTFEGSPENREGAFAFVANLSSLRETFEHNIRPFARRVILHQGFSHVVLQEIAPERQSHFDFIYIDGSHQPDDVYNDAKLSWPLLKNGGILAFDDYLWEWNPPETGEKIFTRLGIDKFLSEHPGKFTVLYKEWQLHVRKELRSNTFESSLPRLQKQGKVL